MSSIIKFFIAADDDAAAGVQRADLVDGPDTVVLGNCDPAGMLADWETAFLARDAGEIAGGGRPATSGAWRDIEADDIAILAAVSPDLVADLAEADEARLTQIGGYWIQLLALDGDELDPVLAGDLLADIARLAARAIARGHGLYCWWY